MSEEIPEKVSLKDRSGKISEETFQKEVSEKISQELQDAVSQKERPKETDEEYHKKKLRENLKTRTKSEVQKQKTNVRAASRERIPDGIVPQHVIYIFSRCRMKR